MLRKIVIGLATIAAIGLVAADTAAVAAVSTVVLPSAAAWPRVVWPQAADLPEVGLLPCPAEQASAECLAGASTTVTTSGTSPFLG